MTRVPDSDSSRFDFHTLIGPLKQREKSSNVINNKIIIRVTDNKSPIPPRRFLCGYIFIYDAFLSGFC